MKAADKPFRAVLDTNVLLSAIALPRSSPPDIIFDLARRGAFEAVVSPFIIDELERNLKKKFGWEDRRLNELREQLGAFLFWVRPTAKVDVIKRTPSDNRILECAVSAKADVLVTGDLKDIRPLNVFQGVDILTPREFLTQHFPGSISRFNP